MTDPAVAPGYVTHSRGPDDAPVTLVEFGDYECPYCGRAHVALQRVLAEYPGRVRLVFRNFPLFQVHPYALTAALAVEAAAETGKFWPMHDLVFEHQDKLTDADLHGYAESLGIPGDTVIGERAQDFAGRVRRDYADGVELGVQGTPTIFVNGRIYRGRLTPDALREAVEKALQRVSASAPSATDG